MKKIKQTTVRPYGEKILFRPKNPTETLSGGIIIPEKFKTDKTEGTVVRLGTGRVGMNGEREPFEFKEGDTVLVSKYGGTELGPNAGVHEGLMVFPLSSVLMVLGADFLQPCGPFLLLELDKPDEKAGSILLPAAARQVKGTGKVLALGNGGKDKDGNKREWLFKTGDRVIFPSYMGTSVTVAGRPYKVLGIDDIIGVIDNE